VLWYIEAPAESHVVEICVPSGEITSTVPACPWKPDVKVVVYRLAPPLVIVVVTVAADGEPYRIKPLLRPLALTVLVKGTAPAESQVVEVKVPSGDTTSTVAGWAFVPEASVVV